MVRLQNDNTELIRELCGIRADNNDLRVARHPARSSVSTNSRQDHNPVSRQDRVDSSISNYSGSLQPSRNAANDGDELMTRLINAKPEELSSLYEPFAAMWNLIRMDPSVLQGKVSAGSVLDRLRGMVEIAGAAIAPSVQEERAGG